MLLTYTQTFALKRMFLVSGVDDTGQHSAESNTPVGRQACRLNCCRGNDE